MAKPLVETNLEKRMLDFIKFKIKDKELVNKIWGHSDLNYKSEHNFVNKSTGEIKEVCNKQYYNIIFSRCEDQIEVSGSLHKLFNNGLHNANDYTVSNCIRTIENFCSRFTIEPCRCHINSLEFGVSIQSPENVSEVVKWLRFHNKNQFNKYPDLSECYFAGSSYFGVKAYNKTLNYPKYAMPNLMRFEGKTRQSKYLQSKKIYTLADLINPSIYNMLSQLLLAEWGNVLIFDKRTKKGVKFCNTDYWLDIINTNHRNTFVNSRNRYYKLLGKNGIQNLIYKRISEKLGELNGCADSTNLENGLMPSAPIENQGKTQISLVQFPPIVKMESAQPYQAIKYRICDVTKLNISMQKPNSKYLCFTGLQWYYETDPEIYRELKERYLKDEKRPTSLHEEFYYIAHNIRNVFTNEIHNRKRFEQRNYPPNQLSLF
ncbi:hypothetical protein [Kaistella sp.]|uniref:hypothetical protein n=1 Tax=Kaistella sp. TaxID=2782235 RepID=UPI002F947561